MRFVTVGLSVLLTLWLSGCVGGNLNSNANVATAPPSVVNAARTNAEELGVLIRVPYETEDVVWREFPAERRILAVLRFASSDAEQVVEASKQYGPAADVSVPVESWFPAELVAQGEMSGDSALKGASYGAGLFFQAPYTAGRAVRIEGTDYFVVEVTGR